MRGGGLLLAARRDTPITRPSGPRADAALDREPSAADCARLSARAGDGCWGFGGSSALDCEVGLAFLCGFRFDGRGRGDEAREQWQD